ncbi:hypothetical protein ABPG72_021466 [Tetrahymena utriculariae]
MKFIALALVSLLVLSSVNVQAASGDASAPTFIKDQNAAQAWVTCVATLSQTPCASSTNASSCETVFAAYTTCGQACFSKSTFSDFNSCYMACGTTATGSSGDSALSSYVSANNTCNSKLSGSLISLSTLLLFVLALIF